MNIKNLIKFIISITIGAILIWYLQKDLTPDQISLIINSIKQINFFYIFIAIFLGVLACFIRAWRWSLLLEPLGYQPNKIVLVCSIFIMYLANLAFPRLGEVLRCSILAKYANIPIEKSIGTMVLERIVDMVGLGLIAAGALFFEYDKLLLIYQEFSHQKSPSNHLFVYLIALVVIGAIILYFMRNAQWVQFIINKLKGFAEGFQSIRNVKNLNEFIVYSILIYSIYFFSTYIFYFAIKGTATMSLTSTFLTLTAGTLGVGMTQGGLGAYQFLVSKTLKLYEIPTADGLAFAWASWLIQNTILVMGGIISWTYLVLNKK